MSNEELVSLYRESGNRECIEQLYHQNYGLINKAANIYARDFEDLQDLRQEAFIILMYAVEHYDPEQGAFSTYLGHELYHRMNIYTARQNGVHIPAGIIQLVRQYDRAVVSFEQGNGRKPKAGELCQILGVDRDKLRQIKAAKKALQTRSLSDPIGGEGEDLVLEDIIGDPSDQMEQAEDQIDRDRAYSALWALVDGLEETEAGCIRCKYIDGLDLRGISEKLDISIDGARRATNRAMKRLKSGSLRSRLSSIYTELYGDCIQRSGLSYFRNHRTSGVEWVVLEDLDGRYDPRWTRTELSQTGS